jgi:hypothetical protein
MDLIQSIKTDDIQVAAKLTGTGALRAKRMTGEWFDLSQADVKAFKH